jgi:hypothetical protein
MEGIGARAVVMVVVIVTVNYHSRNFHRPRFGGVFFAQAHRALRALALLHGSLRDKYHVLTWTMHRGLSDWRAG